MTGIGRKGEDMWVKGDPFTENRLTRELHKQFLVIEYLPCKENTTSYKKENCLKNLGFNFLLFISFSVKYIGIVLKVMNFALIVIL